MTSDAKIGLLLGLVFIFIIAFIINGLPKFRANSDADSNKLTIDLASDSVGLADNERQAQETLDWRLAPEDRPADQIPNTPAADGRDVRWTIPIPQSILPAADANDTISISPTGESPLSLTDIAERTRVERPQPVRPSLPQTYVVQSGDSLADIAKKFYGPEQGNKRANIDRIFQANRNLLSSPHEIYVGQKLTIPPLPTSTAGQAEANAALTTTIFERVKTIGRRHLATDRQDATSGKWYVVRQDDSLWTIAAAQLGSGSRYKEIFNLNTNILDDENNLKPGTRLRMPAR